MTPKEWALECLSQMAERMANGTTTDVIEGIVSRAVQEERERCAKVMDKYVAGGRLSSAGAEQAAMEMRKS